MNITSSSLLRINETKSQKSNNQVDQTLAEYEDKFADYEQLVILFIAGWVISLTLAYKDHSTCLDEKYDGLSFTFRSWLWANFGISITITILFMVGIIFAVFESQKTACLALIVSVLFIVFAVLKVVWIIVGTSAFLYFVNFQNCSDNVIMYCSGQFLVFLSALAYFVLKAIFKSIVTSFSCIKKIKVKTEAAQVKPKPLRQKDGIQKFIKETGNRIKKQLAFWGMLGWIYAMVLAKKDHSICLDDHYEAGTISFRQWFWGDGITTLIALGFFTFLAIMLNTSKQENDQRNMFERMMASTEWIYEHRISAGLFILSGIFKFLWLLVGLSMFFGNLNIEACKGVVVDYLMFYFVWFIYLTVIFFVIFMDMIMRQCLKKSTGIIEMTQSGKKK